MKTFVGSVNLILMDVANIAGCRGMTAQWCGENVPTSSIYTVSNDGARNMLLNIDVQWIENLGNLSLLLHDLVYTRSLYSSRLVVVLFFDVIKGVV